MCLFKKKEIRGDILCDFNFFNAQNLLETYKKYRKLQLSATALSRKETTTKEKYENACKKRDKFGENVFAKEIWDTFNPVTPLLTNADKGGTIKWNELFDKPFDELSTQQKRFLIGLIEGDYVYRLPKKYYIK